MLDEQQKQFNKAAQQLKLRIKDDPADKNELKRLLFDILGYPSKQLAKQHHNAHRLGTIDLLNNQRELEKDIRQNNTEQLKICRCCGLMVNNKPLPYCVDFNDLKIGMGVILFFKNYLFNFLIFALMFLIYAVFALITNIIAANISPTQGVICFLQDNGNQNQCNLASIGGGSKVYSDNETKDLHSKIQSGIGLAFLCLWILLIMIKRYRQRSYVIEMQTKRISASSFTLMITHFPKQYLKRSYQENLEQIRKIFKEYEINVRSKFSYHVVKYNVGKPLYLQTAQCKKQKTILDKKLNQYLDVFRKWIRFRQRSVKFPVPYQKRAEIFDKYVQFYSSQYDIKRERQYSLDQKNLLFVTMKSSSAMREIYQINTPKSIINGWNKFNKRQKFPIAGITIRKAPEPEEIKFEKVGFPKNKKYFRRFIIWLITLGLIGISLGISIGIAFIEREEQNQQVITQAISIGISLIITVINFGIQMAIMYMTYFENQYIFSVQQTHVALKIGIGQIINSIGVPIITTAIARSDDRVKDVQWLKSGGLVNDIFFIALFNLAVPIGRFIDPWEILLKILRWWYSKPNQRLKIYGQAAYNKYFGNYDFDIGYQYAYLIKTSVFTAFFACMQPIIVLFACVGIILYYLADKRNLLRHFQRPSYHYATIDNMVDIFLLTSPIAFGFGHLFVNNFIVSGVNDTLALNIIMVGIGAIFLVIVPFNFFYCCIKQPQHPQWDYEEKQAVIPTDYDRMNPQTKSKAVCQFQAYLRKLEQKGNLPEQAQEIKFAAVSQIRLNNREDNQIKMDSQNFKSINSRYSNNEQGLPSYNNNLNAYRDYANNRNPESGNSLYPHDL